MNTHAQEDITRFKILKMTKSKEEESIKLVTEHPPNRSISSD